MSEFESSPPSEDSSFISTILQPGSSLHPTFLFFVDGAFSLLLLVFITLLFLTSGNLHIFALITIELCLWGSVKWFVNELKKIPVTEEGAKRENEKELETKKAL